MARVFTGLDADSISVGSNSILNPTRCMTFVCWAKFSAFTGSYEVILKRIDAGTHYYALQPHNQKQALFFVDSTNAAFAMDGTGTFIFQLNTWYHMAAILPASGKATTYVNGVLDQTAASNSSGVASITGTTFISKDSSSANTGFKGSLADLAIYNTELTIQDLKQLAIGKRPWQVRPASLVSTWALDGYMAPAFDRVGANTGIVTGTTFAPGPPFVDPGWGQGPILVPKPAIAGAVNFRRTLSGLGTRVGARQVA